MSDNRASDQRRALHVVGFWLGVVMIVCGFASIVLGSNSFGVLVGALLIVLGIFSSVRSFVQLRRRRS